MRGISVLLGAITLLMTACSSTRNTVYFAENTPTNPRVLVQQMNKVHEAIVQPNDILSIHISTISSIIDQSPSNVFNDGGTPYSITPPVAGMTTSVSKGYLVDKEGYIDYPVLGKIKVGGYNIRQIKDALTVRLKDYVKDPVAEVNIINYKVTVLGEVTRPGTIVAPNHRITILDAIAAAGDVPISGKKDNVMVIREIEGHREFVHLNLNSREVFNSPYFYLKQNDIVYVEPTRIRKQEGNDFFRLYLPAITTLISTVLSVYGIVQIANIKK